MMNVDLAGYELIRNPARFDVLVAPNLFGDILADLAGLLVGSRGATYSGNFNASGQAAVYQTNHGCAHDLAGTNSANPAGQILSLAMLLRESFGMEEAASHIERALAQSWRKGWRTADLAEPGCRVVGTSEMAEQVAEEFLSLSSEVDVSASGRTSDVVEEVDAPL
jgi:3-isopropylmalate dehydrogenase